MHTFGVSPQSINPFRGHWQLGSQGNLTHTSLISRRFLHPYSLHNFSCLEEDDTGLLKLLEIEPTWLNAINNLSGTGIPSSWSSNTISSFKLQQLEHQIAIWLLNHWILSLIPSIFFSYREHCPSCQHYTITTVCTLPITFSRWDISSDLNFQNHLIRV